MLENCTTDKRACANAADEIPAQVLQA